MSLSLVNAFWLLIPAILWNAIFFRGLTAPGFLADSLVPTPLLWVEGVLRVATFVIPIFLPLVLPMSRVAIFVLVIGYLVYFATWVPHLWYAESALAQRPLVILGPAIAPLVVFLAIAALTQSWLYAVIATSFIAAHLAHNLYSFQIIG